MAHLEQERRHAGQRVIGLARHGKAGLIADVDSAAGLTADEAFFPQGLDRVADGDPGDAEELRQFLAGGQPGAGLKFAAEDRGADGRADVQAAVTHHAEPGMKPVSEVIAVTVTVTGPGTDPCAAIPPGTPIVFDRMRVGFSVPEARENGRGIRGGRPWYQAADVHQAQQAGRPRPRPHKPRPPGQAVAAPSWPGRASPPRRYPCQAQHIADYWRSVRVGVTQTAPGRLVVRALGADPLALPFGPEQCPASTFEPHAPTVLYVGRDDFGRDRYLPLRGLTGICVSGLPGFGKTSLISSWLCQLTPTPAAQFPLLDARTAATRNPGTAAPGSTPATS